MLATYNQHFNYCFCLCIVQKTPQELKDILANFDSSCETAALLVGDDDDDDDDDEDDDNDDDDEEKPAKAPGGKFIYKFCQDLVDGKITNNNADLDGVFTEVLANCPDLIAYEATFATKSAREDRKIEKTAKLLLKFCDSSEDIQEEDVSIKTVACEI